MKDTIERILRVEDSAKQKLADAEKIAIKHKIDAENLSKQKIQEAKNRANDEAQQILENARKEANELCRTSEEQIKNKAWELIKAKKAEMDSFVDKTICRIAKTDVGDGE